MADELADIVSAFATALEVVDRRSPQWRLYQPGIGPHPETETVRLVAAELATVAPDRWGDYEIGVSYPHDRRQKCDWVLGSAPQWRWAVEVKMLRMMGDNGKPNDNMLMHILSPYPKHNSALTDCEKLAAFTVGERRAVLIYAYEHLAWPTAQAIDAFETLAQSRARLGARLEASFDGLVHPIHNSGQVFGWEVLGPPTS